MCDSRWAFWVEIASVAEPCNDISLIAWRIWHPPTSMGAHICSHRNRTRHLEHINIAKLIVWDKRLQLFLERFAWDRAPGPRHASIEEQILVREPLEL